MIVAVKAFKDLAEMLAALTGKEFEAPRPSRCPGPEGCPYPLWKHTPYERTAIDETGKAIEVTIRRYRCSRCGLTVSCLFDFLIPYLRFTVQAVCAYAEEYLGQLITYEELAWSADGEHVSSKSSIFRWIDRLAERADRLATAIQREAVLTRPENVELELEKVACPNGFKARKPGKASDLDVGLECLLMTEALVVAPVFVGDSTLMTLQRYLVTAAETVCSIFTGRRGLGLSTQQSAKYAIF